MSRIKAVTFDFYETLIHSRTGEGRGQAYREYLRRQELEAEIWVHEVLYRVFEYYSEAYSPSLPEHRKVLFWEEFTCRLFQQTGVCSIEYRLHAPSIRAIFGPTHFQLYPEVKEVLERLRQGGYRLGVISNWQKGLAYFCRELGIAHFFDAVVASAEVGVEKPHPVIFERASRRLGVAPERILHVGDQLEDDVRGAAAAGYQAIWLNRRGVEEDVPFIHSLSEIATRL